MSKTTQSHFENTKSVYSFERSEIRTIQNMCAGDNEKFLNVLADIVGKLTHERDEYQDRAHLAEGKLLEIENGSD